MPGSPHAILDVREEDVKEKEGRNFKFIGPKQPVHS